MEESGFKYSFNISCQPSLQLLLQSRQLSFLSLRPFQAGVLRKYAGGIFLTQDCKKTRVFYNKEKTR